MPGGDGRHRRALGEADLLCMRSRRSRPANRLGRADDRGSHPLLEGTACLPGRRRSPRAGPVRGRLPSWAAERLFKDFPPLHDLPEFLDRLEEPRGNASTPAGQASRETPMAISVVCTCGKVLKAKDEMASKRARCPACKAVVQVPAADKEEPQSYAVAPVTATPAPPFPQ